MSQNQYTIKEALENIVSKNLDDFSELITAYGGQSTKLIQSKVGKKATSLSIIAGLSTAISLVLPSQALGLAGLGVAFASARMGNNTENRTGWAFAGQYATNIDSGFGGLITTACAAARGLTITHIQSSDKIQNKQEKGSIASIAFTAASMVTVAATSVLTKAYSNLILLPALISSGAADYLPDDRSHLARHFRLATFGTLLAYDALIAQNYGGALASGLLIHQYIKTAKKEGDYQTSNGGHSLGSFIMSLTNTKPRI